MMPSSHWLHHGNSIPKIGCRYFLPILIALPKNTPPIYAPLPCIHSMCLPLIWWEFFLSTKFCHA
jgi:hypothetical protein